MVNTQGYPKGYIDRGGVTGSNPVQIIQKNPYSVRVFRLFRTIIELKFGQNTLIPPL